MEFMGYLWASHFFQDGDPLTEIQPIFKNYNGCSLFLRESGFMTCFFGVVRVSPMKSLWIRMRGALGEWEYTG